MTDPLPPTALETIEVPLEGIPEDTLLRVIEAYVLREGTDYGAEEAGFEAKVKAVRRQLDEGRAKLLFLPAEDTFVFVPVTSARSS